MISLLKDWQGQVQIGERVFDSISDVQIDDLSASKALDVVLYSKARKIENRAQSSVIDSTVDSAEVTITVRPYMTRQSTPEFEFMRKWNNDIPMPLRIMTGIKLKETRGMVYMRLHGQREKTVHCMRCGRVLKNPISMKYGIGPECITKIPMLARFQIEDVDEISNALEDVEWEGWIVKSAIIEEVENEY